MPQKEKRNKHKISDADQHSDGILADAGITTVVKNWFQKSMYRFMIHSSCMIPDRNFGISHPTKHPIPHRKT